MSQVNPLGTATAFAVTAGVGYVLCSLIFWLFPGAAVSFLNTLFHGLDFGKLQAGTGLFSLSSVLYAMVGLVLWAFLVGGIYGGVLRATDKA